MQISPSAALLNVLSSQPAQAAAGITQPAKSPVSAQPPALAAAAKALAARDTAARPAAPAPVLPPVPGEGSSNLPRGSVVNILV